MAQAMRRLQFARPCTTFQNHVDNVAMAGPLYNLKWERFAREYASGESLASAYVRAGYADTRNARFNASRLAANPPVRGRINELLEQFAEQSAVKLEYLQNQLLPALRANPQDLFENGTDRLKAISELPREMAAAIKSVKFHKDTGNISEIVLADKVAAAGVLLRSIGALESESVKALRALLEKKISEMSESELNAFEARLALIGLSQESAA